MTVSRGRFFEVGVEGNLTIKTQKKNQHQESTLIIYEKIAQDQKAIILKQNIKCAYLVLYFT